MLRLSKYAKAPDGIRWVLFLLFTSGSMYSVSRLPSLGMEKEICQILILRGGGNWLPPMMLASLPLSNRTGMMTVKIPTDIPLATWIRQLIKEDRVEQFYFTDEWKELRQDVLDDLHNECQECLKKGTYTRAVCVHHVNEVRIRPDLALSRFYVDREGNRHRQLVPLCNQCHNAIHDKHGKQRTANRFTNKERW